MHGDSPNQVPRSIEMITLCENVHVFAYFCKWAFYEAALLNKPLCIGYLTQYTLSA